MTGLPHPEGTITDEPCESGEPDGAFVDGGFANDGSIGGGGETTCSDDSTGSWARYTL